MVDEIVVRFSRGSRAHLGECRTSPTGVYIFVLLADPSLIRESDFYRVAVERLLARDCVKAGAHRAVRDEPDRPVAGFHSRFSRNVIGRPPLNAEVPRPAIRPHFLVASSQQYDLKADPADLRRLGAHCPS
jgi:hypothetical protein